MKNLSNETKQTLENRIKEINRELCRVDADQIRMLIKEKALIEKKLGYTFDPLWR